MIFLTAIYFNIRKDRKRLLSSIWRELILIYWGNFVGERICIEIMLNETDFSCKLVIENEHCASFPFVYSSTKKVLSSLALLYIACLVTLDVLLCSVGECNPFLKLCY